MGDMEWFYRLVGPAMGAIVGLVSGVYSAGRKSAEREQRIKDELREEIVLMGSSSDAKINKSKDEFGETLHGLRQKINDVELEAERRYLLKDDFKEFRDEYRENTNRLFDKLEQISRQ